MKLLRILTFLLAISATLCSFAEYTLADYKPYRKESPKRLYFSPEKERQILDIAKKVCSDMVDDYDISKLTPLIFSCPNKGYPSECGFGNRNMISVEFMKDTTQYKEYGIYEKETEEIYPVREPISIIGIKIFADTMTPAAASTMNGDMTYLNCFTPSYDEFRKTNPGFRLEIKEYVTPEWLKNIRPINEIAEEELKAKRNNSTTGNTDAE